MRGCALRRWTGVVALAPLILGLAACGAPDPPEQEGLTAEQCARFLPQTEEYLFVYVSDDWRAFADNAPSMLGGVQRVARKVGEAADELVTPATADAVQRVRDAYTDVVLLAESYLDEPLIVGDPAAVAAQQAVLDEVVASLADCGEVNRDWPTPLPTDAP